MRHAQRNTYRVSNFRIESFTMFRKVLNDLICWHVYYVRPPLTGSRIVSCRLILKR